jgi:rare lipoprotein A
MKQWPAILVTVLLALNYPGAAAASTKSEPSLWQRLLAAIMPSAQPARAPAVRRVHPAPAAAQAPAPPPAPAQAPAPARAAAKPTPNPIAELVAPLLPEPAPKVQQRPTGISTCNAGQRVISAYYWEGSHTASGEPFNPNAMTAAHRTLPFGTHLTVTNPRNGQSVTVVINDRGPFVHGVSLDLSRGAAQAIGLHGTGAVCIL